MSDVFVKKPKHATSIGGQALIEGIYMMGPENIAIAVRKPDKEIIIDKRPLPKRGKLSKLPIIRGSVGIFRQMIVGFKALMYSAEFVDLEGDEDGEEKTPKKETKWDRFLTKIDNSLEKLFGDKIKEVIIYFSVVLSLAFSVGLFMLLPNFLAGLMHFDKHTTGGLVLYNLFEGVLRIGLFFGYIVLISNMKDIKRVWEYHGAEHKTIHCYESEEELTVENVRKFSTKHPRCGTSFLFTVMIVSILVFSFTGWHEIWINILIRILLIPVVAGLSYEAIKFAGRCDWKIMDIVNAPGLAFQKFTTREPDDSQIEVAIAAIKNVIVEDKTADKW